HGAHNQEQPDRDEPVKIAETIRPCAAFSARVDHVAVNVSLFPDFSVPRVQQRSPPHLRELRADLIPGMQCPVADADLPVTAPARGLPLEPNTTGCYEGSR